MSPSALIPFCEFGGNMSVMGERIDQFNVPVCNSFQANIINDQLCYEVDLNRFLDKDNDNVKKQLKSGLAFIMDYNEDRQVTFDANRKIEEDDGFGLVSSLVKSEDEQHAYIHLNTIGKHK